MKAATKVMGVEMAKTTPAIIGAALTRLGLETAGSAAEQVKRLVGYYKEKVDKKRLADCDICGGISDVNEPTCPYCGDSGVVDDDAPVPPPPPVVEKAKKAKVKAAPVVVEATIEPPVEVVETRVATQSIEVRAEIIPAVQTVIVLENPLREADLDAAVTRVQRLKLETADRLWELGAEVKRICDSQLWLQRTDDNGAPKYKTWGQFTETELEITHSYSYKIMDVAAHYTRDEVRRLGAAKLAITLMVPKEKRAELVEAAANNSVRELNEIADDLGKEQRETGRVKKGGAGTHKTKGASKKPKASAKITVAMLCTRVVIPLYKGASVDKLAKAVTDMPVGKERMFNGVVQQFTLSKDLDGSLILVVERTREG